MNKPERPIYHGDVGSKPEDQTASGEENSFDVLRSRVDYARRHRQVSGTDESAHPAARGSRGSPQALEAALAALSEEMTAEALDRKARDAAPAAKRLAPSLETKTDGQSASANTPEQVISLPVLRQGLTGPATGASDAAPIVATQLSGSAVFTAGAAASPPISNGGPAMTAEPANDFMSDPRADDARLQAEYGIGRSSVDVFHYGGYRYSNLQDAVAEAKRHPAKRNSAAEQ